MQDTFPIFIRGREVTEVFLGAAMIDPPTNIRYIIPDKARGQNANNDVEAAAQAIPYYYASLKKLIFSIGDGRIVEAYFYMDTEEGQDSDYRKEVDDKYAPWILSYGSRKSVSDSREESHDIPKVVVI